MHSAFRQLRRVHTLLLAALALVLCVTAPRLFGFALTGEVWPQDSTVAMELSLGSAGPLLDGSATFNDSAIETLSLWNKYLKRFQFSWIKNSPVTPASGDRKNSVFFSNTVFGADFGSSTLGVAVSFFGADRIYVESDVVFNSNKQWDSYRGPRQVRNNQVLHDFQRVALHEFGHVLGLDHPDEAGQEVFAIMNSTASDIDTLQQDDVNGGQSLYGARDSLPNATPTPTVAPTTLVSFPAAAPSHLTSVLRASDGNLYGATGEGGARGKGMIYRLTPAGELTALHSFTGGADGGQMQVGLVEGTDGHLYGTSVAGGTGFGTAFRITKAGQLTTLHKFNGFDGGRPLTVLAQAPDGGFFGTTSIGGQGGYGTIFKISAGGALTTVHHFAASAGYPIVLTRGRDENAYGLTSTGGFFRVTPSSIVSTPYTFAQPSFYESTTLLHANDGNFYGTLPYGGAGPQGAVFRITPDGTFTEIHSFTGDEQGGAPNDLVQAVDGNLYGTTLFGGADNAGAVFRVTLGGVFSRVASFNRTQSGLFGRSTLSAGADGNLYGAMSVDFGAASSVFKVTPGGDLSTVFRFEHPADGTFSEAPVALGNDRFVYGTTSAGGVHNHGTVFKVGPSGELTTLYSFADDSHGASPLGGLVQGPDGNFYGTTSGRSSAGATVFRITPAGELTTLTRMFNTIGESLVVESDGTVFATTRDGGSANRGSIFKIAPDGSRTALYEFTNGVDGGAPGFGLVRGRDGDLYGTTLTGGNNSVGTFFRITPAGTLSTIYHFTAANTGSSTERTIMQASDGNFYGTSADESDEVAGFIFKLTPGGAFTNLHTFTGGRSSAPTAAGNSLHPNGLIEGRDGNLYGTTGGYRYLVLPPVWDFGTVFRIGKEGGLTTLYRFTGGADGGASRAPLAQGVDGNLYGTTSVGGTGDSGTIFQLPLPGALQNISTRLRVGTGENVLIGGFIITGSEPKKVIVRAMGPSLGAAGVPGTLQDPTLELRDIGGGLVRANNNWRSDQAAEIEATTIPPGNDLESAVVATLAPGSYTAKVSGADGGGGVGLVEVYDLSATAIAKLANISTRGFVESGENVMIGGFIIGPTGAARTKLVVRALGPSLTAAGVAGALQDPSLELYDRNGTPVASNDDWKQTQQTELAATGIPPQDDREAAIAASLAPGSYTAVVRGKSGAAGVAIFEAYNLQ